MNTRSVTKFDFVYASGSKSEKSDKFLEKFRNSRMFEKDRSECLKAQPLGGAKCSKFAPISSSRAFYIRGKFGNVLESLLEDFLGIWGE